MHKLKLIVLFLLIYISSFSENSANEVFKMEAHKSPETEVQRIFNTFVESLGKNPNEYKLFIVENDSLNASAGFNKQITIHSSLIQEIDSEPAIAFVIAHELGHIEKKHVIKSAS